jgi:hypothetical protein
MPRALIFDARVCRGMPSSAVAPDGPDTRPRHSDNAASITQEGVALRLQSSEELISD